ncbi:MAG TPA: hypothetical protein VGB37_16410 [Candidatus Lokiarchaeia archaeon]
MNLDEIVYGMILGIILIKLIEYKLKHSETYQKIISKATKIKEVFKNDNKNK